MTTEHKPQQDRQESGVSSRPRRLTDEETRILIAAEEERLFMNKNGRYEIDQEVRPDRRARENLAKRGLIATVYRSTIYNPPTKYPSVQYRITDKGKKTLRREISKRVEDQRAVDALANEAQEMGIY